MFKFPVRATTLLCVCTFLDIPVMTFDIFTFRFTSTLKEQEQSLLTCQQTCKRLQEEVIEKKRQEEDLKQRTSRLETELETIKNLLRQREEEVVMLKQER